jgi:hypothetical protein
MTTAAAEPRRRSCAALLSTPRPAGDPPGQLRGSAAVTGCRLPGPDHAIVKVVHQGRELCHQVAQQDVQDFGPVVRADRPGGRGGARQALIVQRLEQVRERVPDDYQSDTLPLLRIQHVQEPQRSAEPG